jgi:hypothetical protein
MSRTDRREDQRSATCDSLQVTENGKGEGVPQDYAEAERWWRLAAEQGDAVAQYNLGVMYYYGAGVERDRAEAARWYRLAAEQGDVDARTNLGWMYRYGEGVPKDYALAYMWLNLAAAQGHKSAAIGRDIVAVPWPG